MKAINVLGSQLDVLTPEQVATVPLDLRPIDGEPPYMYMEAMMRLLQRTWFSRLWVSRAALKTSKLCSSTAGHSRDLSCSIERDNQLWTRRGALLEIVLSTASSHYVRPCDSNQIACTRVQERILWRAHYRSYSSILHRR